MNVGDLAYISITCTLLLTCIAAYGWLRGRNKEAEESGAFREQMKTVTTQVKSLETNMLTGQTSINNNILALRQTISNDIDKIYGRFESCRQEEQHQIEIVELKVDNHIADAAASMNRRAEFLKG